MPELHPSAAAVLIAIDVYLSEHGYAPTIRELCELTGLASTQTVFHHLAELERRGLIERLPQSGRAIRRIDPEVC